MEDRKTVELINRNSESKRLGKPTCHSIIVWNFEQEAKTKFSGISRLKKMKILKIHRGGKFWFKRRRSKEASKEVKKRMRRKRIDRI